MLLQPLIIVANLWYCLIVGGASYFFWRYLEKRWPPVSIFLLVVSLLSLAYFCTSALFGMVDGNFAGLLFTGGFAFCSYVGARFHLMSGGHSKRMRFALALLWVSSITSTITSQLIAFGLQEYVFSYRNFLSSSIVTGAVSLGAPMLASWFYWFFFNPNKHSPLPAENRAPLAEV